MWQKCPDRRVDAGRHWLRLVEVARGVRPVATGSARPGGLSSDGALAVRLRISLAGLAAGRLAGRWRCSARALGRTPATLATERWLPRDRSTRSRKVLSAIPLQELSTNAATSPAAFIRALSGFELAFNWLHADSKQLTRNLSTAYDNLSSGSAQRVQMLNAAWPPRGPSSSCAAAMNLAAAQDLRRRELGGAPRRPDEDPGAPNHSDQRLLDLVITSDGSRLGGTARVDRRSRGPRSWTPRGRGSPMPS